MNRRYWSVGLAYVFVATLAACTSSSSLRAPAAPQVTGVVGSPGATTTIDGAQLPPPPPPFGGVIKETANYNMLILAQYRWEGPQPLSAGKHTIVFEYTYDGPGIAKGGTGVLKVDGQAVATQKQPNSIAFLQVADETFDVGVDTRTSVNEKDYQVPFAFNGTIVKLTVKLGPSQLTAEDERKVLEAAARARD